MKFELPKLKYGYDELEPHIDAMTMEIHHSKHHAGYTNKFNIALQGVPGLKEVSAEEIIANVFTMVPKHKRQAIINNGGGYINHKLFWESMTPDYEEPSEEMLYLIERDFNSFEEFKIKFEDAAKSQFGSGWAFLIVDAEGNLSVKNYSNQNSPLTDGLTPILALDVWEHAYYLKYQNKRPDYVSNFWNVVDWKEVEKKYNER